MERIVERGGTVLAGTDADVLLAKHLSDVVRVDACERKSNYPTALRYIFGTEKCD